MSDSKESPIGSQPQGTRGRLPEVLVRTSPLLNNNKSYNKYIHQGTEGFNQPGNTKSVLIYGFRAPKSAKAKSANVRVSTFFNMVNRKSVPKSATIGTGLSLDK